MITIVFPHFSLVGWIIVYIAIFGRTLTSLSKTLDKADNPGNGAVVVYVICSLIAGIWQIAWIAALVKVFE